MFEKIFIYSPIDRKLNKIPGVWGAVKMVLILFPLGGLGIGLFSCYVKYISPENYKMLYYMLYLLLMVIVIHGIIRWLVELFNVYAIGKDGKFYRFRMMSFASGYLGFGRKVSEVATKNTGRLAGTFELMMKVRETIEGLENEEQVEEMFAAGYLSEISDIKILKNNGQVLKISAMCNEKRKKRKRIIKIRKVYDDWQNLFGYIKHISKGENKDYVYIKRTSYHDLAGKKYGYLNRVLRQTLTVIGIVAWLGIFMLSGDISRESSIRSGKYVLVRENTQDDYKVYESVENPSLTFKINVNNHMNYKPLLAIFMICEVLILTINIDMSAIMLKIKKDEEMKKS